MINYDFLSVYIMDYAKKNRMESASRSPSSGSTKPFRIKSIKYSFLLLGLYILSTSSLLGQVSFNVNGAWNYRVASNLEAGSDFSGTYTSDLAQVYLSATKTKAKGNFRWNVSVHKEDNNWDASMNISARRTGSGISSGNGNGGGLIQGGTNFQQLNSIPTSFFTGKKGRLDIPIQYQIENVSVLIPSGTYSTTVIFTMTDL